MQVIIRKLDERGGVIFGGGHTKIIDCATQRKVSAYVKTLSVGTYTVAWYVASGGISDIPHREETIHIGEQNEASPVVLIR